MVHPVLIYTYAFLLLGRGSARLKTARPNLRFTPPPDLWQLQSWNSYNQLLSQLRILVGSDYGKGGYAQQNYDEVYDTGIDYAPEPEYDDGLAGFYDYGKK